MIEKLEGVGALEKVGVSKKNKDHKSTNESDDNNNNSDFNKEDDKHFIDTYDDKLDKYFLSSDDYRTYGDPSSYYFPINESLTGTTVLKFQPLGAIQKKKQTSKK